ncbi:MAG: ParA family protein [Hyphomicrobiaceae bacterium]
MAKFIAVANMKGGVGKTTTVVSLAETLAAYSIELERKAGGAPKSILVVDLDAQASASFALAGDTKHSAIIRDGRTIDAFLDRFLIKQQQISLASTVSKHISDVSHMGKPLNIALIASSPHLRTLERGLIHVLTRGGYSLDRVESEIFAILRAQLDKIATEYDYILFDCPPGISVMTEVAIRISDLTIVPTIPDFLSILGLDAFSQNVWSQLAGGTAGLPVPRHLPHVLITKRKKLAVQDAKVKELRDRGASRQAGYRVLQIEMPESQRVSDALERIESFPNYAQKWDATLRTKLADLVDEMNKIVVGRS